MHGTDEDPTLKQQPSKVEFFSGLSMTSIPILRKYPRIRPLTYTGLPMLEAANAA